MSVREETASAEPRRVWLSSELHGVAADVFDQAAARTVDAVALTLLRARVSRLAATDRRYSGLTAGAFVVAVVAEAIGVVVVLLGLITKVEPLGIAGVATMAAGAIATSVWLEIAKRERSARHN